jgi:hypothetical protein
MTQKEETKILGMSTLTFGLVAAGTASIIAAALHERAKTEKAKYLFYYDTKKTVTKSKEVNRIVNKSRATEPAIGKYRLYFNEDDEIVEESAAIKDPK